jgi:cholesterol oxidase
MTRLTYPPEKLEHYYDVVIVGSGYGGSIAASRLARAGRRVCLLERGKEFQPGEYPDTSLEAIQEIQADAPARRVGPRTGLFDFRLNNEINVFQGCGVGGTSLINSSVCMRPDPRVFRDIRWPREIRNAAEQLDPQFERVETMLGVNVFPAEFPKPTKFQLFEHCAAEMGAEVRSAPLAVTFRTATNAAGVEQNGCSHCGDCITGCNHRAKNTLVMNYLPDARNFGAEIFAQAEVRYLTRSGDRWLVHYRWLEAGRESFGNTLLTLSADTVILAAGTLGSTEILLRSREHGLKTSNRLGRNFSGNGDAIALAYNCDRNVNGIGWGNRGKEDLQDAQVGPCITGMIDLRETDDLEKGLVIQEGAIPGALAPLMPLYLSAHAGLLGDDTDEGLLDALQEKGRSLLSMVRGPYRGAVNNTLTLLVVGHDSSDGQMTLENDRIRIHWQRNGGQHAVNDVEEKLYAATQALGGTLLRHPVPLGPQELITVHPLGGCVMSDDGTEGVVNHQGQVFSTTHGAAVHDGLYVCDGSIIPRSLGVNPLLTIGALAERNVRLLAQDRGWTIDESVRRAPLPVVNPRPGIQFTERMTGFFALAAADHQQGWDAGKATNSAMTFLLTIHVGDLDAMLQDPVHRAALVGTVECAALSAHPLSISNGEFRILAIDPQRVGTREMVYTMTLTSVEGGRYFLRGRKVVHDDPGFDLWSDTTTLTVDVHPGDESAAISGRGILRIKPFDLLRMLSNLRVTNANTTAEKLRAQATFGRFFAGVLYDTYGGVAARASVYDRNAPPRKKRTLNLPAPEVRFFTTDDGVRLQLTRYRGGSKGPVMLVAGMGTTTLSFTIDTLDVNLAESLCSAGYDVWLFDYRASPAVPEVRTQFALDEIALHDYPAAIREVRAATGADSVQVIAHCVGSATLLMSIAAGQAPDVRSAICSQFTLHVRSTPLVQMKANLHLASLVSRLGIHLMNARYDSSAGWKDRLYERLLRLYPAHPGERCDSPVCRRIRFLYGETFQHSALNHETHRLLYEIFGEANLTILNHLSTVFRRGHIVDRSGKDAYLQHTDRLAIPITFLQGAHNKIFLPEGSRKTWQLLVDRNGPELYELKYFPEYAHMDLFIGKDAYKEVYPYLVEQLDKHN